ncbi:FtsX-like permease family protein [Terasakiella sp. SH-1]|uniref:ABC transporter permease n=1 Tax=Terasakiella sp. SH-1 TaxID=2560057 RepID=UPI0010747D79|nr:FtsX-like permease family protein [Terasakiella sp. SH-1]
MNNWTQSWRLARRELRGGTKGFRIFLACLILGVTTIAAVFSLNQSISAGLARDGKVLLGGDIDLRLSGREITDEQQNFLQENGRLSHATELRAMAQKQDKRLLVELKAVDSLYPLVGAIESEPAGLSVDENTALIEPTILDRLHLKLGDTLTIGKAEITITGVLKKEPDRIASVINFGPRILVSQKTLENTQLLKPGSVVRHHYRLLLNDISISNNFSDILKEKFPEAGWRMRTPDKAAPGVENFIDRLSLFLSFVGFTTLLIGGVGVSSGVRDYLNGKIATIATFKSLGASSKTVFQIYFLQIFLLSLVGIGIGLFLGASVPYIAATVGARFFPVQPESALYLPELLIAATFGILTVLSFAFWPLGRTQNVPASALFRDKTTPITASPAPIYKYLSYLFVFFLIALTLSTAHRLDFAIIFVVVAALVLGILKLAGQVVTKLAQRAPHFKQTSLRLAITALHRPGSTAPSVILSLGLGLSVLVAVTQIDQNLRGQINDDLPKDAPAFFFIDIQNDQITPFDDTLTTIKGASNYKRVPSLRGRITKINGVDVDKAKVASQSQWAIRGDRALTYAAQTPEGSKIIKGEWWAEEYRGKPLISLDAGLAKGFGVDIGDTLSVNVLGRNVTATITSLREINWKSMRFDFAIIMSPGLLEYAPHSHIAAVHADDTALDTIEKSLARHFPNVSIIRVKDALQSARNLMDGISTAIGLAASLTVMAGGFVLAGAMASGREQRTYEAIVFKVLGATRGRMLLAYLIEYGLLGLVTGLIAAIVGTLSSWGVITFLMNMDWAFYPQTIAMTLFLCLILTIGAGFIGTWQALGQKAAPHLRNE